jgi:hypothetical protein
MTITLASFNKSRSVPAHLTGCALIGYMGYRAVIWALKKCQKIEKIEQVATISDLKISEDKITMGQGEYIVFRFNEKGQRSAISADEFEIAYQILLSCAPSDLAKMGINSGERYELIKRKLENIDPSLKAIFVPKTLYELIFIRKSIKEDYKFGELCEKLISNIESRTADKEIEIQTMRAEKCWHQCYFEDAGNSQCCKVKKLAYRLNNIILKELKPLPAGFTYKEFLDFTQKEIDFLLDYHERPFAATRVYPCPTTNFKLESQSGGVKPMGLRGEKDASIIRKALTLECSEIARHSLFLYRGADFQKDSTISPFTTNTAYSLSYGASLFAGSLYDGGAAAFHYMRKEKNAYAIAVPFDKLHNSLFFVPSSHSVAQLSGRGEIFHARTKVWKNFELQKLEGMWGFVNGRKRDHLRSDLSKEDLEAQFQNYKSRAFQLKD